MQIYAFCNVHDLSWGTKGAEAVVDHSGGGGAAAGSSDGKGGIITMLEKRKLEEEAKKKAAKEAEDTAVAFATFRSQLLMIWIAINLGVTGAIKMFDPSGDVFMFALVAFVSVINFFRFFGSISFLLILLCRSFWACLTGQKRKAVANRPKMITNPAIAEDKNSDYLESIDEV